MCRGRLAILSLPFIGADCTSHRFVLTDESAMERLMGTRYVEDLQKRSPAKVTCHVEGSTPGERDLYLGEDQPDHTVRLRACRVTSDGRVWVNADNTLLDERWVVIE